MDHRSPVHEIVNALWRALHQLGSASVETHDIELWGFSIHAALSAPGNDPAAAKLARSHRRFDAAYQRRRDRVRDALGGTPDAANTSTGDHETHQSGGVS